MAGLLSIAEKILQWAEANLLSLSWIHLKGGLNSLADALSKETLSQTEWCLNRTVLEQIVKWGGPPDRPLRYEREQTSGPIFHPPQRPPQFGARCPIPTLGSKPGVCISTVCPQTENPSEDKILKGEGSNSNILIASF